MQTHTKESWKKVIGQNNLVYASQTIVNIMFVGDITAQIAFRSFFADAFRHINPDSSPSKQANLHLNILPVL